MKTKTNTREKILETMYRLVAEEGYHKASIGNICKEIGITKPAVYHYFKSKEEIFLELIKTIYVINEEAILKKIEEAEEIDTYKEMMRNFGIRGISKEPPFPATTFIDYRKVCSEIDLQSQRNEKIEEYHHEINEQIFNLLRKMLRQGIKVGLFKKDMDIEKNANTMFIMMVGIGNVALYGTKMDLDAIWRLNIDRMIREDKI